MLFLNTGLTQTQSQLVGLTYHLFGLLFQDYYTLDGHAIRIYSSSGMKKDIIMPSEEVDHLCHIRHVDSFVAWKFGATSLFVSLIDQS